MLVRVGGVCVDQFSGHVLLAHATCIAHLSAMQVLATRSLAALLLVCTRGDFPVAARISFDWEVSVQLLVPLVWRLWERCLCLA